MAAREWQIFVYAASTQHKPFCQIAADITTFLIQNPAQSEKQQFELLLTMFAEAARLNPDLAEEINSHIALQLEFREQRPAPVENKAATVYKRDTSTSSTPTIFKPLSPKPQPSRQGKAPVAEALSSLESQLQETMRRPDTPRPF